MFYKPSTKERFNTHSDIRAAHQDTSLPAVLDADALAGLGLFEVAVVAPEFDPITQSATELEPTSVDGKLTQQWVVSDLPPDAVTENRARAEREALAAAKAARHEKIAAIVVTTAAGNAFDGDEKSQDRMTRALAAMEAADTLPWVLHDNTVATVTRAELKEALRAAGTELSKLWLAPLTGE
jgi:hypothetical protein